MDATTARADALIVFDMLASRLGKIFSDTTPDEREEIATTLRVMADHGFRFSAVADANKVAGLTRRWSPASAPKLVEAYNHALSIEPATLFDGFMLALIASTAVAKGAAAIHSAHVFGAIAELLKAEGLRAEPWNPQWDTVREQAVLATEGVAA